LIRVGLATALAVFILQIKLDFLESYLYDIRVRIRPAPAMSGHVSMIMIRPSTVEYFKGTPSFSHHTLLLQQLLKYNPKVVIYDIDLKATPGSLNDQKVFAETALKFNQFYILTDEMEMRGEQGKLRLPPPLDHLQLFSGPKSSDKSNFAKDGVTRRVLLDYQGQMMLHPFVAAQFNPEVKDLSKIKGVFEFFDTHQTYINFRPSGTYPQTFLEDWIEIPDSDVIESAGLASFSKSSLKDKIVLIGQNLELKETEYAMTPYSRTVVAMTNTETHANAIDTLILNNSPERAHEAWNWIFTILISIITIYVVFGMKPSHGLVILAFTFLSFACVAMISFWPLGYWVPMAHPFLAIFLCYYFFIPYRLIIENRRSWEYYQKNKLLQQVEELKTNFISMMSHDLKTPIARIQGMVDVITKTTQELTPAQREAVDGIKSSSDDLLKFINSILNYAKIESQGVELHSVTKDVNKLLEEVIKKHEFMAQAKKIKIIKELDPLFPIQVDPELIKQVFSNLIENAIKYSPESTQVRVASSEVDGKVFIKVFDQGPGIPSVDLPNIFMKFFRSQNAKSSTVKGSGLGLYLAKYFTELHKGELKVESQEGQGSIFTVILPLSENVIVSHPQDYMNS